MYIRQIIVNIITQMHMFPVAKRKRSNERRHQPSVCVSWQKSVLHNFFATVNRKCSSGLELGERRARNKSIGIKLVGLRLLFETNSLIEKLGAHGRFSLL